MTADDHHRSAMRRALEVAATANPHPNPRVGAVILDRNGDQIAVGAHRVPGEPHAEALALAEAGERARGATVVVTLEPCSHTGRVPPCADALISAGVRRVVIGAVDPDRRVSGSGIARLRAAGIDVEVGVDADLVEEADPGYFHHRRTGFPLVTLKAAMTLDGQMAAADGSSQWITSEEARRDAHRLRSRHDAVVVGAGTVRDDDPRLDVRLEGYSGRQPAPVVVAGQRPLPPDARIWQREPIVLAAGPVSVPAGTVIQAGSGGRVDLRSGLAELASLGHLTVLVEGGSGVAAALWNAGLVNRGVWYLAATIAGGIGRGVFDRTFSTLGDARRVEISSVHTVGGDLRVEWVTVDP